MGPKKKVKKTKAELAQEKLARELEAKKQRDLEEKKRLQEAEKRRIEDLRIQELRRDARASELDRLRIELEVSLLKSRDRSKLLVFEQAQEKERLEWLIFTNPSNEPEPSKERDVNTFISVIEDTPVETFADALNACERIERVALPMTLKWGDDLGARDIAKQAKSAAYIDIFSKLIIEKLDLACLNLLRFVDLHLNEKSELSLEENVGCIYIGLWAYFGTASLARKEVKFSRIGFEISIPKQILQQEIRFVHRVIRLPFETNSLLAYRDVHGRSSKSFLYVIGDLHIVELLVPPPLASKIRAKKWTLRDNSVVSMKLRKSPYPSSANMKCTIRVPDTLIMSHDVRAGLWNPETSDWTEAGIADYHWNESERKVEFYLTALGTVALLRDRISDMPYSHWSLRAVRKNFLSPESEEEEDRKNSSTYEQHARFSVTTKNHTVVIDIVGAYCRLKKPDNSSTADILDKDMTPGALCRLLQCRGINIVPTEADLARVLINPTFVKVICSVLPTSPRGFILLYCMYLGLVFRGDSAC